MQKKRNIVWPLVFILLTWCAVAQAGTLKTPVPAGDVRLKSFESGAQEQVFTGEAGVVLMQGRSSDPGTKQAIDFLSSFAKKLKPVGTDVVVALSDVKPKDPGFQSMLKSKGWGAMRFACSVDAGLTGKALGSGAGTKGTAVMVVGRNGMIEFGASGVLGEAAKDALIRAAIKTAEGADISLNTATKTISKGKTFSLKPILSPKVSAKYVRYQSSDTRVARVSQAGKVKGVGYGTATISAAFGQDVAECEVVVTAPLKSIKLNEKNLNLQAGDSFELSIDSITPFNANVDIDSAGWSSSNPRVATVQGGSVSAIGAGKAKISVKLAGKSASCSVTVSSGAGSGGVVSGSMQDQVLQLVNQERASRGLRPLVPYDPLESAANVRAEEISRSFSHTRPNGKSCFTAIGFKLSAGGENIAMGFDTAEDVMRAWMNSPGHKKNILASVYRELGVGIYERNGTMYWVQMFSKKK